MPPASKGSLEQRVEVRRVDRVQSLCDARNRARQFGGLVGGCLEDVRRASDELCIAEVMAKNPQRTVVVAGRERILDLVDCTVGVNLPQLGTEPMGKLDGCGQAGFEGKVGADT